MKNSNISKFITSLAYMLLGICLIIWPDKVGDVVCTILAACAVIIGLFKLIAYTFTKVESRISRDTNGFAIGLSLIILGIFLWLKGTMIVVLIPFILGFMITFKGIEGIQNVLNFKKFGYGFFKGVFIASIVITIFGIIVMMNPFTTAKILYFMLGLGLLVSGLADFISDIFLTARLRKANASDSNQ